MNRKNHRAERTMSKTISPYDKTPSDTEREQSIGSYFITTQMTSVSSPSSGIRGNNLPLSTYLISALVFASPRIFVQHPPSFCSAALASEQTSVPRDAHRSVKKKRGIYSRCPSVGVQLRISGPPPLPFTGRCDLSRPEGPVSRCRPKRRESEGKVS